MSADHLLRDHVTPCEDCGAPATVIRDDQTRCDECSEKAFREACDYYRASYDPRLDSPDAQTRLTAYLELKEPWRVS